MKTERVYSKNAAYQKFEVLKTNRNKRYKYFEFFVEGVRNINCAVKNNWEIQSFLYTTENPMSTWAKELLSTVKTQLNYELSAQLLSELSGKEDSSELMAVVKMREDSFKQLNLSPTPLLALFDRPSNKGNLGTIIRSCDALGVDGLIITGHAVDLYDPDVVISTMGSFFNIPVIRIAEPSQVWDFVADMKKKYSDFITVGTTAHKEFPIFDQDLSCPLMLLIGNETDGLARGYKDSVDKLVTIPMAESSFATSFNVGCAATAMLYEVQRQRTLKARP